MAFSEYMNFNNTVLQSLKKQRKWRSACIRIYKKNFPTVLEHTVLNKTHRSVIKCFIYLMASIFFSDLFPQQLASSVSVVTSSPNSPNSPNNQQSFTVETGSDPNNGGGFHQHLLVFPTSSSTSFILE